MSDLNSKLAELQAQLGASRGELEAAQSKAAESTDLHAKLNHLTRARAAQDLVSSIEQEISAVQHSIAEAQRREHRQELLARARSISHEVSEHREDLEALAREHPRAENVHVIAQWPGCWPEQTRNEVLESWETVVI